MFFNDMQSISHAHNYVLVEITTSNSVCLFVCFSFFERQGQDQIFQVQVHSPSVLSSYRGAGRTPDLGAASTSAT